jgi:hypothetical protein
MYGLSMGIDVGRQTDVQTDVQTDRRTDRQTSLSKQMVQLLTNKGVGNLSVIYDCLIV